MEGLVRSPQGNFLEGVHLILTVGDRKVLLQTDAKGRFVLPRLPRGKYSLLLQ